MRIYSVSGCLVISNGQAMGFYDCVSGSILSVSMWNGFGHKAGQGGFSWVSDIYSPIPVSPININHTFPPKMEHNIDSTPVEAVCTVSINMSLCMLMCGLCISMHTYVCAHTICTHMHPCANTQKFSTTKAKTLFQIYNNNKCNILYEYSQTNTFHLILKCFLILVLCLLCFFFSRE